MRRILIGILWCCAALLLASCAKDAAVSGYPPDKALPLSAEEKVAIVADAGLKDEEDIPKCVREKLLEARPGLQLMAAGDFRQMAGLPFSTTPDTMDEIRTALADPKFQAEADRLALRYLLIVGGGTESDSGYYAYTFYTNKTSRVEAKVWNVPAAEYVESFSASARGSNEWQFFLYAYAATEKAACESVAKMLAERMS